MLRYRIPRTWARCLALVCLSVLLPLAASAQVAALTDADRLAIRSVIQRQLDAFKRDDAPAAFELASPAIQARFRNAATFLAMVRESYQAVYRPKHVQFLEAEIADGQAVQKVLVTGPDGEQVLAIYPMFHKPDGAWATDGCMLVALPSKSA
ncbi:MAG TPA: DUF4864 domain-containing protein [bacterium]